MQTLYNRTLNEGSTEAAKQKVKQFGEVLFLGEAALMFASLFLVTDAIWFHVLFHIVATAFAIVVLRAAYQTAQVIPASFPFQRALGVVLYVPGHLMQFILPGQLPIECVAILLITCPLAMLFLFA